MAAPPPAIVEPLEQPRELELDSRIACRALHAIVAARVCLLRQAVSRRQRTQDTCRGQGSMFPSCTDKCEQGAAIRASVPGADRVRWRGAGPGGRFDRGRGHAQDQMAARRRLELVGLLDEVSSIDALIATEESREEWSDVYTARDLEPPNALRRGTGS
jgi:hypothetical protein